MPLLISMGYTRLQVVVLKDRNNKAAHENSAQLACEAAGAIRTVASLTREDDCLDQYSLSLEGPLRASHKAALWSNLLYAASQSMVFFVIALIFWYGARLVSDRECTTSEFFVCLMVSVLMPSNISRHLAPCVYSRARLTVPFKLDRSSHMPPISPPRKVPGPIS